MLLTGVLGVLVAQTVAVLIDWRWALPAAGVALVLFGLQVQTLMAGVGRDNDEHRPDEGAGESLNRWKSQTESMLHWADGTRGEWDRYLRPKLARDFLQATRQKEPAAVGAAGQLLFGDELWQWVDPQNVSTARRHEPAPGRDTLDAILTRLELS